jgi:1A family penicillin-binding protein
LLRREPPVGESLVRLLAFVKKRWPTVIAFALALYGPAIAVVALLLLAPPLPAAHSRSLDDSTKILDRDGRLLYEVTVPQEGMHTYLSLDEIAAALRQATIAVEDSSFYSNPGFDVFGMTRALVQNVQAGEIVAGGSTITQQLVRNLYLSPEERTSRSLWRKARETILAVRLTRDRSKDDILELYLNQVYYGNLAYGAEAAARTYFGKSARDLDLAEASLLAGLPQSPARYDPLANLPAAKARQATVLSLMEKDGYISREERQAALDELLRFREASFPVEAPHFVVYVRGLLEEMLGPEPVEQGGLRVYTSLDLDMQRTAEAIVSRRVAALRDNDASNAALVALDPETGQVLAMIGSTDYFDDDIDGAVNMALAPRQPGSSIKPITYAAALERGYTAATPIPDVRTSFLTRGGDLYVPNNYDATFHGLVSLRRALASSFNVPAVRVMNDVGIEPVLRLAYDLGITTFDDVDRFDLSLTLGGGEVRLLDLTAAFAAFADGGLRRESAAVLRVEDSSGEILYQWEPSPDRRVLSPQVAYLITDILSDDAARAPTFGLGSVLSLSRPAAVKTGTTSDFRDNWTVGYTPSLVAGVWVGNADNQPMQQVSGVTGAAPIWHDFMEAALDTTPREQFPRPEGLVHVDICEPTGLLPGPWCPERRRERFIAGTAPTAVETYYRPVEICLATGQPATPSCPPGQVVEQVYVFPPPEIIPWAREAGLPMLPEALLFGGPPSGPTDGQTLAIALVSPDPELVVEISGEIPREHQRLAVEALVWGPARPTLVELYQDGDLLASLQEAPYRVSWPLSEGTHVFQAAASDDQGNRVMSESVKVTVLP